jgi:RNA polymerase sigma-70 factor (ECF subfamily)
MAKPEASDPRTDLELIDAINAGRTEAFEILYHRHRDWVARLAFRFTGDSDDALDVLQEVFTYLYRKFPGFRLTSRMTTFLYPAVKHAAISIQRKRGREMSAGELREVHSEAGDEEDPRAELAAVMSSLPAAQREVLLMRFVDDMSMQEIAEALGIPEGTVKSRLHHGLARLREDPRTRAYFET